MHRNNFDFLRILFAVFVIITHSYPVTLGSENEHDWLQSLTSNQLSFSGLGLMGFFSISGYLIFNSLKRSKSLVDYYLKRCLRILPGLLVVLVFTSIVFFFLSPLSFVGYFGTKQPWRYVYTNFSLYFPPQADIHGTIQNHPYPGWVNASIWTIRYEFLFYVGTSFLYFIRNRISLVKGVLVATFLLLWFLQFIYYRDIGTLKPFLNSAFYLYFITVFGLSFTAGALLAVFKAKANHNLLLVSSVLLVLVNLYFNSYVYIAGLFTPIIIIIIGLKSTKLLRDAGKYGDPSYGTYLYGFVIQQILIHYFKLSPVQLMSLTIPLAIVAGFLSWYLIEKKALKYKSIGFRQLLKIENKFNPVKST